MVGKEKLETTFSVYYDELFTSFNPAERQIARCVQNVWVKISEDMKRNMERVFLPDEVERDLKQMFALKSPGSDGFGVGFYKNHCELVGKDTCEAVLGFLNGGGLCKKMNHTF